MTWTLRTEGHTRTLVDENNTFILGDEEGRPYVDLGADQWALIAASPALLRAAEEFMANLWKSDATVAMGPEIEALRAAIAQARGQ